MTQASNDTAALQQAALEAQARDNHNVTMGAITGVSIGLALMLGMIYRKVSDTNAQMTELTRKATMYDQ